MTGKISEDPDRTLDGTEKYAASAVGSNFGVIGSTLAAWLATLVQTLTGKTINAASNTISNLTTSHYAFGVFDTDPLLAANSDTRIASQKAVKAYTDAHAGSGGVTPAALTKTDDINVTLALTGLPATALLQATQIIVGWSGTLGAARGGFGANVSAASGVPLFAAGVATFTATTGSGNFVRAADPVLSGNPTAPTPAPGDNDTSIATTAFVTAAVVAAGGGGGVGSAADNIALNARCDVSQENLGLATLVATTAKYCLDQWEGQFVYAAGGATVQSGQSNASIAVSGPLGIYNCLMATISAGAMGSIAAGDYLLLRQKIEGSRIMRLQWGTASAQPLAWAAMVYASAAGVAFVKFSNFNKTRCYYVEVTLAVGWNFVSGSIAGDTTVSSTNWPLNNTLGLQVEFFANGKGGTLAAPGAWTATNAAQTTNSINLMTALNSLFAVTGLWLSVGATAPTQAALPSLMRPLGDELPLCRRYWTQSYAALDMPANVCTSGVPFVSAVTFGIPMRVAPTALTPVVGAIGTANTGGPGGLVSVGDAQTHGCYFQMAPNTGTTRTYWYGSVKADARM